MQIRSTCQAAVLALMMTAPTLSSAQDILTITTAATSDSFTLEELLEMPQTTVTTANDYVDGVVTFQGPSLRHFLESFEIGRDATLRMVALNDYAVKIPASDGFDYNVVLAILKNGEEMPVRDIGPIWVIYPMSDHSELRASIYNDRLVWQLKSIFVE
jgi:hypothetical protein